MEDAISTTGQGPSGEHLKEEEGSSPHTDRGSPPPNCSICLGKCKNKCFTDSCFHQFCFKCLLQWSKIKAECPLCKQTFKSIIHNVRSNHQYDEYTVEQAPRPEEEDMELQFNYFDSPRFRYRTTVTLHRRDSLAIQRFLNHLPDTLPRVSSPIHNTRSTQRRTIYRHNLWAQTLPDITGRYRESSPEFYRANPAQIHRLVPWLQRELMVLLADPSRVAYVLRLITDSLPIYSIDSAAFRIILMPYIGSHLSHFIHEFTSFAKSPYDMVGYDRSVQYNRTPLSMYSSSILSSDTDSDDSDIMCITPTAGPSYSALLDQSSTVSTSQSLQDNVIAIETISHSDTDDSSSEVMVVGFIKPPQDRTPEVVDLLASDSDVVLNEPEPEPPGIGRPSSEPDGRLPTQSDGTPPDSMVKVKLKRSAPGSRRTASSIDRGRAAARKRRRFRDSASTSSTVGDTSDDSTDFSDTIRPSSDSDEFGRLWEPPPGSHNYTSLLNRQKSGRKERKMRKNRTTLKIRNRNAFDTSTDNSTSSDSTTIEKIRTEIVKKSQNSKSKKTKKSQKKEDTPKRRTKLSKKSGNSRDSAAPKKKQKLTTKSCKDNKVGRTCKAKARSADQIKSSQKKPHSRNTAASDFKDEERPSTSSQHENAVEVESNEISNRKRLKSVVNVVDVPPAGEDAPGVPDRSQSPGRVESADSADNAVSTDKINASYNSDGGSSNLPEDIPLKFLFPTSKERFDNPT